MSETYAQHRSPFLFGFISLQSHCHCWGFTLTSLLLLINTALTSLLRQEVLDNDNFPKTPPRLPVGFLFNYHQRTLFKGSLNTAGLHPQPFDWGPSPSLSTSLPFLSGSPFPLPTLTTCFHTTNIFPCCVVPALKLPSRTLMASGRRSRVDGDAHTPIIDT